MVVCRTGDRSADAEAGRRLLEHAGRSSRALGAPRLSVRLIDYEVGPSAATKCTQLLLRILFHWM